MFCQISQFNILTMDFAFEVPQHRDKKNRTVGLETELFCCMSEGEFIQRPQGIHSMRQKRDIML